MGRDVREIELGKISPNLRSIFEMESIVELSRSIQSRGQIDPIEICFVGDSFRILDGEKRWRACRKLGMSRIKAIIVEEEQLVV